MRGNSNLYPPFIKKASKVRKMLFSLYNRIDFVIQLNKMFLVVALVTSNKYVKFIT